ncbi:polyphosphate kinase 2 family protein [Roseomonas sp. OT10]|uniref:polyphosphate kinase 2 family protein n=1 Tax=Roseomonas cutis TaxID=2897332 RepID=UPI001E525CCC|nr:polyphosphate kinase 2 family protein [Roseomonas sp. OT10]UFN51166.1 polyphosphate kinase 2 family protein [Roseomonas sp. OT10]
MGTHDDLKRLTARCRVTSGKGFDLGARATDEKGGVDLDKKASAAVLSDHVGRIAALQDMLHAQDRWAVLCLFQAMDAAGKDGTIKHVFSGVNPQGCQVQAFSAPGGVERDHDFLWRHVMYLPQRGRIGIHNRSWYEEVLVVRVHQRILAGQKLPARVVTDQIWDERLEDIAGFERYLTRQGIVVLKFFLHVGEEEQRARLLARIDQPDKNWKMNTDDLKDRALWKQYAQAYEAAIRATATSHAPWFVVPADRKWLARLIVAQVVVEALEGLGLKYPTVDQDQRVALEEARQYLT